MEKLLEIINCSKSFSLSSQKRIKALDDINLTVFKNETLGILGESGCGKSTLARLIMGVYPVDHGQIVYRNQALNLKKQRNRKEFAKQVQMIFQDPYASLDPHMTIQAILCENLEIQQNMNKKEKDDRVKELLKLTGLSPEFSQRYPHEFSGGQRQRVGIARALAVDPEFIILDEPCSALDNSVQSHIMDLLIRLKEERGLTYLFISHDLNIVRTISDRIAVMYAGKIVEIGNTEDIYHHPHHPYTQMLLQSVLSYKPNQTRLMMADDVQGEVNLNTIPAMGCPFADRCVHVQPLCRKTGPTLKAIAEGHFSACYLNNPQHD